MMSSSIINTAVLVCMYGEVNKGLKSVFTVEKLMHHCVHVYKIQIHEKDNHKPPQVHEPHNESLLSWPWGHEIVHVSHSRKNC